MFLVMFGLKHVMKNIQNEISDIISLVPPAYDNFKKEIVNKTGTSCCVDILNLVSRKIYSDNNEINFSHSIKANIKHGKYT